MKDRDRIGKPEYRRDMEHNYMVLSASEPVNGNEYEVRVLLTNQIAGLLKCKTHIIDGKTEFYYEISSRQPMDRVFGMRGIGSEDLCVLFAGIKRSLENAAEFLLNDNCFILAPEYLYMDPETKTVDLCYLPFYEGDIVQSFRGLAEYILQHLDHEDERAVLWGYGVYSRVVQENYSVKEVLEGIHRQMTLKTTPVSTQEMLQSEPEKQPEQIEVRDVQENEERAAKKHRQADKLRPKRSANEPVKKIRMMIGLVATVTVLVGVPITLLLTGMLNLTQAGGLLFLVIGVAIYFFSDMRKGSHRRKNQKAKVIPEVIEDDIFEETESESFVPVTNGVETERNQTETTSMEEPAVSAAQPEVYGMTTVLNAEIRGSAPVLISIRPELRENIIVTMESMLIGKMKSQVEIFLDLPTISRLHAKIERTIEGNYLTDLNSTNGTFLNGERLQANESRKLETGDEIFFAEAGYYFKG